MKLPLESPISFEAKQWQKEYIMLLKDKNNLLKEIRRLMRIIDSKERQIENHRQP